MEQQGGDGHRAHEPAPPFSDGETDPPVTALPEILVQQEAILAIAAFNAVQGRMLQRGAQLHRGESCPVHVHPRVFAQGGGAQQQAADAAPPEGGQGDRSLATLTSILIEVLKCERRVWSDRRDKW
jgi:hypothetical protein